jgi:hypothetical protein
MAGQNEGIVTRWFTEYWGKLNPDVVDELAADDLLSAIHQMRRGDARSPRTRIAGDGYRAERGERVGRSSSRR